MKIGLKLIMNMRSNESVINNELLLLYAHTLAEKLPLENNCWGSKAYRLHQTFIKITTHKSGVYVYSVVQQFYDRLTHRIR